MGNKINSNKNHSRINKVVHTYNNKMKWEEILENIIINHLKTAKRLDL